MKVLENLNAVEKKVDDIFSILLDDFTLGNKKDVMYLENKEFFDKTCKLLQKLTEDYDVIIKKRANEILDKIKENFEKFKEMNQDSDYYSNSVMDSLMKKKESTETEEVVESKENLSGLIAIKAENKEDLVFVKKPNECDIEKNIYMVLDKSTKKTIDRLECNSVQEFLDIINTKPYSVPVVVFEGRNLNLQLKYTI